MKFSAKTVLLLFLIAFTFQNCSRKKDTFVNRNFHALGTKYNILYNGNLALERGINSINDAFTENFWELLPVERMEIKDEVFLPGQNRNQDFERAEEKAIKAVQLHGMTIQGKEKNPQMDEAYLLLGKSRYFDQRFVPALAAFNNIMNKYPTSDKINQVKVWREKANMRLGNDEGAIKNLKRHLYYEDVEGQDLSDIAATLAQAYINLKYKDSALVQLEIAANSTKINREKGRFHYIRGQLYDEFGKRDSANLAYNEVIEMHRKIPRAFYINAHLAKSNNFDTSTGDKFEFYEYLTELEEDRENRPFLDKIYHRIAKFHQEEKSDSLTEVYYNKSLRATAGDKVLNAKNYSILGNMYFDRNLYKTAGAYYDSTLTNMVLNSKPYRTFKKKRENLDDVIYYEDIAKGNDSILRMISLPKSEQLAIYKILTDKLKAEVEAKEARNQASKDGLKNTAFGRQVANNADRRLDVGGIAGSGQSFYFYNPTTVAYGKNEFIKVWGERELQDNWRLSNRRLVTKDEVSAKEALKEIDEKDLRYEPEYYIAQLPTSEKDIDSIVKERNFAYYQLGLIYKEKFSEYKLAQNKLETLLKNDPEERLVLPSKYNLFKIYELRNLSFKADEMKSDIIANHSGTRYAELLQNPGADLTNDENSPEAIYERLYELFEKQKYAEVIIGTDVEIKRLEGEDIVPKFEILKASARGRLFGFEAYKESVNHIALTYPNAEEGKKAQDILEKAMPVLEKKAFVSDDEATQFHAIYKFDINSDENIDEFVETLNKEVSRIRYFDLYTSIDVYDENTTFVVIHGLKSMGGALGFGEILNETDKKLKDKVKITRPYFSISSPNYAIIQRHKNLNLYLKSE